MYDSPKTRQGMPNDVGLTFGVGDPIPHFTISIKQGNWNWWH